MDSIVVNNVKKKFRLFFDKSYSLKERFLFKKRNYYEDRWVLKGVSFKVKQGEAIGIIGANGCGKSTLLKLLTQIYYPDEGEISIKGRVSSLIELGAGFHPDMSGRENIYTNASIFGLSKSEIEYRMDDIISFSELEEFIDNPVRTYSSGMYMRLAFSVAINVDADVLLIDEILAVGDAAFQSKCFNKLREIKGKGTTIVIVSHSLGQIEQICERSLWIYNGKIKLSGSPRDVHPEYLSYMNEKTAEKQENVVPEQKEKELEPKASDYRWGNQKVKISEVALLGTDGEPKQTFKTEEPMAIRIGYTVNADQKIKNPNIGIAFYRNDGVHCYGTNTKIDRIFNTELKKKGSVLFQVQHLNLLPGRYAIDVAIVSEEDEIFDYIKDVRDFSIFSDLEWEEGISRQSHYWIFE